MSVFRRTYKNKRGTTKTVQNWTVDFVDHTNISRRVTAFSDRSASIELERCLKKLVALRMSGVGPDAEMSRFLETCPVEIKNPLIKWGVLTGQRATARKPLPQHISDWEKSMEARGNCSRHIRYSITNVQRVTASLNWRHISDFSVSDLNNWIADQKTEGMSAQTINHYLRAVKGFCGWLVKEKRITENPVTHLPILNVKTDRRVERRALTVDEIGGLLAATESGSVVHGMMGKERSLLYRMAMETGLR